RRASAPNTGPTTRDGQTPGEMRDYTSRTDRRRRHWPRGDGRHAGGGPGRGGVPHLGRGLGRPRCPRALRRPAAAGHPRPRPPATLDLGRRSRVALKGPCTTPVGKGFRSINVALRKELDLYASVRPVSTLPGVKVPYRDVDLVVVRENTEGLYSGQEHVVVPGVVESLRIVTRSAAERIVRYAFELVRREGRSRVTFCHKADVMPLSDGLFLTVAREVADDFPFIEFQEIHVDELCLQLALDPTPFDVLVMENLFGDVISDLCAGLVGGLGVVPGANVGGRFAVFEAVHGSAPDIAGQGK